MTSVEDEVDTEDRVADPREGETVRTSVEEEVYSEDRVADRREGETLKAVRPWPRGRGGGGPIERWAATLYRRWYAAMLTERKK